MVRSNSFFDTDGHSPHVRRSRRTLGIMQVTLLVERALQRLVEARPRWLRWLEAAPLAVREADRLARRAYLFYQLPCVAVFVCLYSGAKHLGWLTSHPIVALWLPLPGIVALVWPVYIVRLALAARQSVASLTGTLALRLRTLAAIGFILAGLIGIALASLVGFVVVVTVAMPTQSPA